MSDDMVLVVLAMVGMFCLGTLYGMWRGYGHGKREGIHEERMRSARLRGHW